MCFSNKKVQTGTDVGSEPTFRSVYEKAKCMLT